jgi:hypothetical protein
LDFGLDHFLVLQASKLGHLEIVQLLSGFSSCDTKRKNKDGLTPAEVACERWIVLNLLIFFNRQNFTESIFT